MVDTLPSDMDDLFDFRVPSPESPADAVQYATRRAARTAAGSRRSDVGPATVSRRKPRSRRLKRSEVAAMRASTPKAPRKHPLSVLVTMTAVTGMLAVVGLPAYATTTDPQTVAATDPQTVAATKADTELQSVVVGAQPAAVTPARDGYRATTEQQLAEMSKDSLRAQNNAEYLASGARELGDDYPWAYELSTWQGGGLSPLNYFYRQCVDFVAWRLNRDAGSYAAPYKWVWSTLTPSGGNAYQWKYSWEQHGWTVSDVPIVGSVAWFGTNHVSYVKEVLPGGYVLVEEYNFVPNVYSQRTLALSEVSAFLYPPA